MRVYIAHPLTGEWPAFNVERYLRHCADAMNKGHTVVSWVVNYLTHTRGLTCGGASFYLDMDFALIDVCDELWVCGADWETSSGVQAEIAYATKRGIRIDYREWDHECFPPAPDPV
jgi:hypothetical protein